MRTGVKWVSPVSFEECNSPPGVTPVAELAPLSPFVVTPVVGSAPLNLVAAVPELHAGDVLAVHAAVVVPPAFPNVLCLPALLSCLRNMDLRHIRLTTPVVYHAGSDTATSEVLKASHTKDEVLRTRVLDSVVVHLASGLTVSDPTPGFPKLSLPQGSQEPSRQGTFPGWFSGGPFPIA